MNLESIRELANDKAGSVWGYLVEAFFDQTLIFLLIFGLVVAIFIILAKQMMDQGETSMQNLIMRGTITFFTSLATFGGLLFVKGLEATI